jgi:hypothetical protein
LRPTLFATLLLLATPVFAQQGPIPATGPAPAWIARSNAFTQQVLDIQIKYSPEEASSEGLAKYDTEIGDVSKAAEDAQRKEEEEAVDKLEIALKTEKDQWGLVEVPDELKQWCKFGNCCAVDGVVAFPPLEYREEKVGWLVATGDTLHEVIDTILERIGKLPPGLETDVMPLAELLKEVQEAEEQGIEFAEDAIPDPSTVLEEV